MTPVTVQEDHLHAGFLVLVPEADPVVVADIGQDSDGAQGASTDASEPLCVMELSKVSRRYETPGGVVIALEEVDLRIQEGEFVVVLGPSGSGKTTLLNMMGALDAPSTGTVRSGDRLLTGASHRDLFAFRRGTVSFVFQAFNLFPELTAIDNVRFGAEIAGKEGARERATSVLGQVGLADRAQHYPGELSGGEQQRVAIARALAAHTPLLLADEPTGELDFRTGIQILQLLRDRAEDGRAVVLVTHNREIARIADRVVEISSGRVISSGPPEGGQVLVSDLRW